MSVIGGAPRDAYASNDFIIVSKVAIRALGSWEAAGCFQRIAWRAERDGAWRATMAEIAEELCVSERTAKRLTTKLRERGWVTAERDNSHDATLTWRPVFLDSANLALSGETAGQPPEGQTGTLGSANEAQAGANLAPSQSAKLALTSSKTGDNNETLSTSEADAPDDTTRDLNEGREDVDRVCQHLSERLTEHQVRHTIGKGWRNAARLAMDSDGHSEAQMHRMIDWCQSHHFWHTVIHSMPNLRDKYDTMRQQALADSNRPGTRQVGNRHTSGGERSQSLADGFGQTG